MLVGATAGTLLAYSYITTRQFLTDVVMDFGIPFRVVDQMIGKLVWLSFGFWLALGLLVTVVGLGILGIVGEYRAARLHAPERPGTR